VFVKNRVALSLVALFLAGCTTPVTAPGPTQRHLSQPSKTAVATAHPLASNALSMTTTNNLNFGSRIVANGAIVNNALTNFTGVPRAGQAAPNRMQAGKRPVTSMAPTIVFDRAGIPVAVGGSAGVAKLWITLHEH
jgi:gamma-glutamyltranspeptidase / glutathione hydrolase